MQMQSGPIAQPRRTGDRRDAAMNDAAVVSLLSGLALEYEVHLVSGEQPDGGFDEQAVR